MLTEYALIPDIFDSACYSTANICGVHLQNIKEAVLHEGLVRNLGDGRWQEYLHQNRDRWHTKGKELIQKLATQNRLRVFPKIRPETLRDDLGWVHEALATHGHDPISGIVVSELNRPQLPDDGIIGSIERLHSTAWWQNRSSSVRLIRNIPNYLRVLRLTLSHANSLMFIDPHLDPSKPSYHDFIQLLLATRRQRVSPKIEIHRVCYYGSPRTIETNQAWEVTFRRELGSTLQEIGNTAEIFIWDDFHDRYLISDLIGISIPNGFDVTTNPQDMTTWTRLGRKERDDVQREFDPASRRHDLKHRFVIP